jgi:hypothetical protein
MAEIFIYNSVVFTKGNNKLIIIQMEGEETKNDIRNKRRNEQTST